MPSPKNPGGHSQDDTRPLIDEPNVPAIIDPNDPDGLISSKSLDSDLAVEFMGWSFGIPGESDRVELGFQSIGSPFVPVRERYYLITDPINIPFPKVFDSKVKS